MTRLVADSIGKRFGTRRVLTAATLRAEAGMVCALLGRNGAGKSTLLNIAAGVIAPDHGLIIWGEQRLERTHLWRLARDGVMLLPTNGVLSPSIKLREQLDLIASTFGGANVEESLQRVRLENLGGQRVGDLSGGEQRRAQIAAALVRRPRCLLADEVFVGLAPLDADLIGETLRAIAADACAVVITGHEIPFLMRYADRITWCTAGTTLELGSPSEAARNDAFRAAYLGEKW